jgi:hypothetical protein
MAYARLAPAEHGYRGERNNSVTHNGSSNVITNMLAYGVLM